MCQSLRSGSPPLVSNHLTTDNPLHLFAEAVGGRSVLVRKVGSLIPVVPLGVLEDDDLFRLASSDAAQRHSELAHVVDQSLRRSDQSALAVILERVFVS